MKTKNHTLTEKTNLKKVLVFRFSAMGDVALCVPVLKEILNQNPELEVVFVSRKWAVPLFENIPRLTVYAVELDQYKGVFGLFRLYKELKSSNPFAIADLHHVLRTNILDLYFKSSGIIVKKLDKRRAERKALLKDNAAEKTPLKPVSERYADVFRELGFKVQLKHQLNHSKNIASNVIGIAPFARYQSKQYPLDKMKKVALLLANKGYEIHLFGSKSEASILEEWIKLHSKIKNLAGQLNLSEEIKKMQELLVMVAMDSANMHLASLAGTRVVSIWGATHPAMGFLGYGQSLEDVVQDETIKERPVTVFGPLPKAYKNFDFFQNISPEMIVEKVLNTNNII